MSCDSEYGNEKSLSNLRQREYSNDFTLVNYIVSGAVIRFTQLIFLLQVLFLNYLCPCWIIAWDSDFNCSNYLLVIEQMVYMHLPDLSCSKLSLSITYLLAELLLWSFNLFAGIISQICMNQICVEANYLFKLFVCLLNYCIGL